MDSSKKCQVCGSRFTMENLYPTVLVRGNILNIATEKYPNLNKDGFICYPDLRKISAIHFEEVLKKEKGALSELEKEVLQNIQQHEILSDDIQEEFEKGLTFGQRLSDKIAMFGGSWTFIITFMLVLFGWIGINSFQLLRQPFDPFPFIFLNLVLSCLAAIQAPIIMMSQNRQATKDRLSQDNDYQTNLKAELQIRQLNARLELFMKHNWQKMHEISRLQEEIVKEIDVKK